MGEHANRVPYPSGCMNDELAQAKYGIYLSTLDDDLSYTLGSTDVNTSASGATGIACVDCWNCRHLRPSVPPHSELACITRLGIRARSEYISVSLGRTASRWSGSRPRILGLLPIAFAAGDGRGRCKA